MTRASAGKRLVIGVPYMLAYVVVLFPIALTVGIVLGTLDVAWRLATQATETWFSNVAVQVWDWIGGNARWTLTGEGQFRWLP